MKTPEYILAIDPSGSFYEGKGVTGWCVLHKPTMQIECANVIRAEEYNHPMDYYKAHIDLIENWMDYNLHVVIEDYLLYANQAEAQINSRMETIQLIGILKYTCWDWEIPLEMQPASMVKLRWENKVLLHKGIICPKGKGYKFPDANYYISRHVLDAVRHAMHYATFYERKAIS